MSLPVFNPPVGPDFDYPETYARSAGVVRTDTGFDQPEVGHIIVPRTAGLVWRSLSPARFREIASFFLQRLNSGAGPFQWRPPHPIPEPTGFPVELATVAGGALADRTYNLQITWYTALGETIPGAAAQLFVPGGQLVQVYNPAAYPNGVIGYRIYAAPDPDPLMLQASVANSRTWTEPATGLVVGSAPPTENTARADLRWLLVGTFPHTFPDPAHHRLSLTFREQFY